MKRFSEYSLMVDERIKSLCPGAERLPGLYEPIKYAMSAGGKRLRPVLVMMMCEAFGGNAHDALEVATGMEMFHNFTLLHDDVMDKSDMRRSRPTVHKKWNENTAILSGDTMLTMATELICKVADDKLRRVIDTFNRIAIEVYEGQQMDVDFEQREDVTLPEYMEMIRLKTSALLGGAALIGAIVGGADEKQCSAAYRFGEALGLAFQIQDDLLDTFGDESTFGKPIGGDILNNKKTWLWIWAMNSGGSVADALCSTRSIEAPDLKIKAVTKLYEQAGVPAAARTAIATYSSEALRAVDEAALGKDARQALHNVVERLLYRKK